MVKRSRIIAFFIVVLLIASTMGLTTDKILGNIKLGLDLQGGFEVLYEVKPAEDGQKIDEEILISTVEALDRRINVLGVSEPNIQIEGEDRIRVQLAGVTDQEKAREMLSTEANLTFRDANDKLMLDGRDLAENGASMSYDQQNRPAVSLTLKSGDKFGEVTEEVLSMYPENQLVIWLDFEEGTDSFKEERLKEEPKYLSAPVVDEVLSQKTVQITGNFTPDEAKKLANLLNAGALPVELEEQYSTSVGAKFGQEALSTTIFAGIIGILAIFAFMVGIYRFPGFIAMIILSIYIYLVLLVFDWMNGVLTLPGIAALILGVGMAVDANILTYERIREELKVGRNLQAAFKEGNKNSLSTIVDANLTTLIAAIVLFVYGTSSVKGFATMLILSILLSFVTAVLGSRIFLGMWVQSGLFNKRPGWFGVKKEEIHDISENVDALDLKTRFDKINFVKHYKKFFILSGALIAAGLAVLLIFRLNLGIDFSSGTRIEMMAEQEISVEEFKQDLYSEGIDTNDIVISGENSEIGVARYKDDVLSKEEIASLKAVLADKYGSEPNISTVSPMIGKELAKNAFFALLLASVGLIIYVSFRFEMRMAIPALLSLLHDAFLIIAVFSILRIEIDLTFIAAILTIIGYSINDTIVTFDRIRENMKKKKKIRTAQELADIVNTSLRQTMVRSVNTVLTVVLPIIALLIFGSEAIWSFSFALLVGLVAGTYSSLCIAAQLWYVLKKRELKKKGTLITYKEKKKYSDEPVV